MPRPVYRPTALPEIVVDDEASLNSCIEHLRGTDRIGFDTEFVGEDTYRPELCLIQISCVDRLYLIDPLACRSLDTFWELMTDPNRLVIVHAGREEVRMCYFAVGLPPANIFDVQIAAGLVGMTYPIGYAGLVQEVLGIHTAKSETLTDWRRRPLSPSQIRYAYDDVRFLLPIHHRLSTRLRKLQRESWAAAEFSEFTTWAVGEGPTVERWRKMKGIGRLNRKELAVARALYTWRESFAARVNRPPRIVLRDEILVELARTGVRSPDDISSLRGVPRQEVPAILAAVHSARSLPSSEHPQIESGESDPPQVATLGTLLGVVLGDLCARLQLAPNLVSSGADLKGLVRSRQPGGRLPDDSPFASGWRAEAILPHLEDVLAGRTGIRVSDPGAIAPLDYPPQ